LRAVLIGGLAWMLAVPTAAGEHDSVIHIGVLAKRGAPQTRDRWQPTIDYLAEQLPGQRLELVSLSFDAIDPAVAAARVDFVLANSAYYVRLEHNHHVRRIATLRNKRNTRGVTRFGGVVFTRADQDNIRYIRDLHQRHFGAVHPESFGGYLMALHALDRAGVRPRRTEFLGTHDAVVYAVRDGRITAGTVRSDTLERMAAEGKIDLDAFRVIGDRSAGSGFPFRHSTPLYPEWPLAALAHVPDDLSHRVAVALLQLPPRAEAATLGHYLGWAVPLNYQPVHQLLRDLELPPYHKSGRVDLRALATQQPETVALVALVLILLTAYGVNMRRLNRVLVQSERFAQSKAEEADQARLAAEGMAEWAKRYLNIAGSIIVALDSRGHVELINQKGRDLLGHAQAEVIGHDWFEFFVPSGDRDPERRLFQLQMQGLAKPIAHGTSEILTADGRTRVIDWDHTLLRDADGQPVGQLRSGLDVTHRVQMEQELRTSQENFDNVVRKNRTGILLVSAHHVILFANPAAEQLLGQSAEQLRGTPFTIPPQDARAEMPISRSGDGAGTAELSVSETEWYGAFAYLVMLHDITERKAAEAEIRRLAYHDPLTGLPNRSLFRDRLEHAIRQAQRNGRQVGVLFMDLDRFKEINDSLGHAIGDQLLKAVAGRLQQRVRGSDTVARMGGDEFTVLVEDVQRLEQLDQLAQTIRTTLQEPLFVAGQALIAVPSIGVAVYPWDGHDAERVLRCADAAMYQAKRAKREGIARYDSVRNASGTERLNWERDLRQALHNNEFSLVYQVQVDLSSSKPVGLEALLRWHHPRRGRLGPEAFVPWLEETGLIIPVGAWVLGEATRQITHWQTVLPRPVPVAVNISVRQLTERNFLDTVETTLRRVGIHPRWLHMELTEAAVARDTDHALQVLGALTEAGISLHLDDFGTGDASLSLLRRLPFDTVKVDRSLVRNITDDPGDARVISAIIAMAHPMDKQVTAEGVETEAQHQALRARDCDIGQGWLYGRPVPPEAVPAVLGQPQGNVVAMPRPGTAPSRPSGAG
jgi:diguanylate cyclase (GGDEF)-like protein/PAS domain S-box-containing protein